MALRFIKRDVLLRRNLDAFKLKMWLNNLSRCNSSTMPAEKVSEPESLYPPVKSKYPPGKWKSIGPGSAWKIHDLAHKVLEIPNPKERLEFHADTQLQTLYKLWLVEALAPRPNNLEFQKIITKTNILPGEPEVVKNISCEKFLERSSLLSKNLNNEELESVIHGTNKLGGFDDVSKLNLHYFVGNLLRNMVSLLSSDNGYLMKSEIDENVRVESFWRVCGFDGVEKSCDGAWELAKTEEDEDIGVLQFQFRHNANFQIRAQEPLPEFLPMVDDQCYAKDNFLPQYNPEMVAMKSVSEKPISVSGHWIGSPCEFTSGSIHVMPTKFVEEYQGYGMKYLEDAEVLMAMTSMFGSCLAQAHNQGFCDSLDITYPITTQSIIINKHNIRFAYYQMNTLQLWNDGNPLQNLMWVSQPIKLFQDNEDGMKQTSKEFMSNFLKFLLLEPKNRGINLRPYLPDEKAPDGSVPLINSKGKEPFEQPTIGRWQYPKYSLYF